MELCPATIRETRSHCVGLIASPHLAWRSSTRSRASLSCCGGTWAASPDRSASLARTMPSKTMWCVPSSPRRYAPASVSSRGSSKACSDAEPDVARDRAARMAYSVRAPWVRGDPSIAPWITCVKMRPRADSDACPFAYPTAHWIVVGWPRPTSATTASAILGLFVAIALPAAPMATNKSSPLVSSGRYRSGAAHGAASRAIQRQPYPLRRVGLVFKPRPPQRCRAARGGWVWKPERDT